MVTGPVALVASTPLVDHWLLTIWAWLKTINGEVPVKREAANPPAERSWAGFFFRFFLPFFGFFGAGHEAVAAERAPNCETLPEDVPLMILGAAIFGRQ